MNEAYLEEIQEGLKTAFIDRSVSSNLSYRPQFISNDYREGRKVLSSIEEELQSCDSFKISVAFITMSGIAPLLQTLQELDGVVSPERSLLQIIFRSVSRRLCGYCTNAEISH